MIGYYVHHQGAGHLTRAGCIASRTDEPVVVLSSARRPDRHPFGGWIDLPMDVDDRPAERPTAGDAVHWAPLHVPGLRRRMATIAAWVERARPRLVVVDVSVEVLAFVRLLGVPVAAVALPGSRDDPAHQLGYRLADRILAPWAQEVYDPEWLRPWADRTVYSGVISRYDGRPRPAASSRRRPRVLLLGGRGGSSLDREQVAGWARAVPGADWTAAGIAGAPWRPDLWTDLTTADVVVSAAGQNSVADLAAASATAVVVPEDRPYDEQRATADALARQGAAVVRPQWPAGGEWAGVLDEALTSGRTHDRWEALHVHGAARRAALALAS